LKEYWIKAVTEGINNILKDKKNLIQAIISFSTPILLFGLQHFLHVKSVSTIYEAQALERERERERDRRQIPVIIPFLKPR